MWLLTREAERNSTLAERGASSSARSPYLCTGRAAPVKDDTQEFGHDSGPLILSEGMEELMFAEQHEGTMLTPKRVSSIRRLRTSYSRQTCTPRR